MTALLPTRAPAPTGRRCPRSTRRRVAHLGIAAVVLVAAGSPFRGATPEDPAGQAAPPSNAPPRALDEVPQAGPRPDDPQRSIPQPRPLAPVPPPDGRDAPDPFILRDGGRYLLYSTQVGLHNVPVASSPDLRHWSSPSDALPQLPAWAEWGRTWAPGVMRLGGRYLLYFAAHHVASARQCIGVATSATATGPFVSEATEPLVCQTHLGGSIDPHPFIDRDGTASLLWKADGNAIGRRSTLFAQRLTSDGLALTGQPIPLLSSDAAWEQPLIENPALIHAGGSYTLLYSGGWWESASYAIGYAMCDTPLGPCTKATIDRPLLASGDGQAGPGGATVITGPAGDQWLAYHAWAPKAIGYANGGTRCLHFASLTWPDGIGSSADLTQEQHPAQRSAGELPPARTGR
jgi:beta-xylosidase